MNRHAPIDDRLVSYFDQQSGPNGSDLEAVKSKTSARQHRRRASGMVAALALLAGGVAAFTQYDRDGDSTTNVEVAGETNLAQAEENTPTAPATIVPASESAISWSLYSDSSALSFIEQLVVDDNGTLYALSTAPGDPNEIVNEANWKPPIKAIYRDTGAGWEPQIASDQYTFRDIAVSGTDLYAVGTAAAQNPSGDTDPGDLVIAKSTDGGVTWATQLVGPDLSAINAEVRVNEVGGSLASGPGFTLAATRVYGFVDGIGDVFDPEGVADFWYTDTGVDVYGFNETARSFVAENCPDQQGGDAAERLYLCLKTSSSADVALNGEIPFEQFVDVVESYTYAELGGSVNEANVKYIGQGAYQLWVNTADGFVEAETPFADAHYLELVETEDSVLAIATTYPTNGPSGRISQVFETSDGQTWTPVALPGGSEFSDLSAFRVGDRLFVGVDSAQSPGEVGARYFSSIDGSDWQPIDLNVVAGARPDDSVWVNLAGSSSALGAFSMTVSRDPFLDGSPTLEVERSETGESFTLRLLDENGLAEVADANGQVVGRIDAIWDQRAEEPAEETATEEFAPAEENVGDDGERSYRDVYELEVALDDGSALTVSICDLEEVMSGFYGPDSFRSVIAATTDGEAWALFEPAELFGSDEVLATSMAAAGDQLYVSAFVEFGGEADPQTFTTVASIN